MFSIATQHGTPKDHRKRQNGHHDRRRKFHRSHRNTDQRHRQLDETVDERSRKHDARQQHSTVPQSTGNRRIARKTSILLHSYRNAETRVQ